jgi:hypothetical protein
MLHRSRKRDRPARFHQTATERRRFADIFSYRGA